MQSEASKRALSPEQVIPSLAKETEGSVKKKENSILMQLGSCKQSTNWHRFIPPDLRFVPHNRRPAGYSFL
jgi:hypothetical protein